MKTLAARIRRAIAEKIPGSALASAVAKRKYERELREQGVSRKEAARLTWEHFRNRG